MSDTKLPSIYKCRKCSSFVERDEHCGVKTQLLLDGDRRLKLSKLLSAILRHLAVKEGIEIQREGWIDISQLAHYIRTRWRNRHLYKWVEEEHIVAVALTDRRGRFQLSNDMKKIRATYGHTIGVKIDYKPLEEHNLPSVLYHGTIIQRLPFILKYGLKPMRRLYVHLTNDRNIAEEIARRHGDQIAILEIDSSCIRWEGFKIYKASPSIYLVEYVPPKCIKTTERK